LPFLSPSSLPAATIPLNETQTPSNSARNRAPSLFLHGTQNAPDQYIGPTLGVPSIRRYSLPRGTTHPIALHPFSGCEYQLSVSDLLDLYPIEEAFLEDRHNFASVAPEDKQVIPRTAACQMIIEEFYQPKNQPGGRMN
jgi:hypothetical protein